MGILLYRIHIQNFRSIRDVDITLHPFTVLFGMNDSGKSNLVLALKLAMGNMSIDITDVFSSPQNPASHATPVLVDLLFVPINENDEQVNAFDENWALHLGDNVMSDQNDKEFFAFRTEFRFDDDREEYIRDRKLIREWTDVDITIGSSLKFKTLSAFDFISLDAHRDIASDIRDKTSVWNKQISKIKLSGDARTDIEDSLAIVSQKIMQESPFLREVSAELASATNTKNSSVEISPITRSVDELYKGLDIYVTQENSSSFSISNMGLGTRSRAVFTALKTIVNKRLESVQDSSYFCMLAFEEPEAHIHPHSQRQLVKDFLSIKCQKIVTTHSPYLLSSTSLTDLICVSMKRAETICNSISLLELTKDEIRQIERFVLNTRGDLLFSQIVILAEGETEEQALQIFFKKYFGKEAFELGVSIIGVGGKNYLPFLRVLECIGTPWIIFSDGEPAAISDLQTTIKKLRNLEHKPELSAFSNILVLDGATDFETYLLDNNYDEEIIAAINAFEDGELEEHQLPFFEDFVARHHGELLSPKSTGICCETCGQTIKTRPLRDYLSDEGQKRALCDCMKAGKAKYAASISKTICEHCSDERKFPPKIKKLMEQIESLMEV